MATKKIYNSIDIFSGCGGLSAGLYKAGFNIKAALEIDGDATRTYAMNHKKTYLIQQDIRTVKISEIKKKLKSEPLHLLAGCPPCQGFSSVRRLNGKNKKDIRNDLILEYLRFVKALKPYTIMMENVPGLIEYYKFKFMLKELVKLGYNIEVKIVNVKDYGVPQRRRRLVMVGSKLGLIKVAKGNFKTRTVRDAIGKIEPTSYTKDPIHKIYPTHSARIMKMIRRISKNGGSRNDLHWKQKLDCHKKDNVGFNDIYGRLSWDNVSTTITGGCLNPSKGRFLHPTKNRTITAREAALLQTFPKKYKFPLDITRTSLSLLIGNALPPKFSYIQCKSIKKHLTEHLK
ncbi:MAG: DNA cytosine methyltransferase [Ignavibacteria bacterium]|nr:DNA cytosine methyltransferase [Ignavibacteria bacterium]